MITITAIAEPGSVDRKATDILRDMCSTYQSAETIRSTAEMKWVIGSGDSVQEEESKFKLYKDGSDRFALKMTKGTSGGTIVADGSRLFTHMPVYGAHATEDTYDANEAIASTLARMADVSGMPGMRLISDLMTASPYEALMTGVTSASHIGQEKVQRKQTEHIQLVRDGQTWDLWILTGDRPTISRFSAIVTEGHVRFDEFMLPPGVELTAQVTFNSWKFDKEMRDKYFKIKAPRDSQQVDTFADVTFGSSPDSIIGSKAPNVTMALNSGDEVELGDYLGKNVIVLDFWASWCGPCRVAMPNIIEITDSYKDQGVQLFAVNHGEARKVATRFLEKEGYDCTVAIDPKRRIGRRFGVSSLPTTIIIGPDGTIQAIHRGWSDAYKKQMRDEIDKLLAGKSLVSAN